MEKLRQKSPEFFPRKAMGIQGNRSQVICVLRQRMAFPFSRNLESGAFWLADGSMANLLV